MIDDRPIQSFDLPESCEHDLVAIYPNDGPDDPHFYAVPFDLQYTDDGTEHYKEPDDYTVTEEYRKCVAEQADVSIEEIKLKFETVPAEEVDPI